MYDWQETVRLGAGSVGGVKYRVVTFQGLVVSLQVSTLQTVALDIPSANGGTSNVSGKISIDPFPGLPDDFYIPLPEGRDMVVLFLPYNLRAEVAESLEDVDRTLLDEPPYLFHDPTFGTVIHIYARPLMAVVDVKDMEMVKTEMEQRRLMKLQAQLQRKRK